MGNARLFTAEEARAIRREYLATENCIDRRHFVSEKAHEHWCGESCLRDIIDLEGAYKYIYYDWVGVEEELPKTYTKVLAITKYGNMYQGILNDLGAGNYQWELFSPGGTLYYHDDKFNEVTHWRMMPLAPKDKG